MGTVKSSFITSTETLCSFCNLSPSDAPYQITDTTAFACRVPLTFAQQIKKDDWFDPLLLQVLPRAEESAEPPSGFSADPLNETAALAAPGLLHKYQGRVLLLASSVCAINCRYCFRREQCHPALPSDGSGDEPVLEYLRKNDLISEVILSGGDPLMLTPQRLKQLCHRLSTIPHLTTLRIHTRIPIVLPQNITRTVLAFLSGLTDRFTCIIVVHANHAQEITSSVAATLRALSATGTLLLNQSVLLEGINNTAEALGTLSKRLIRAGVTPYYLHQLDTVRGTHHFQVPEATGRELLHTLRETCSGFAVPRYVIEVPGGLSKRVVAA